MNYYIRTDWRVLKQMPERHVALSFLQTVLLMRRLINVKMCKCCWKKI